MTPDLFLFHNQCSLPFPIQWSVAIKDTIDEFVEAVKTAAAGTPETGKSEPASDKTDLADEFAAKATVSEDAEGELDDFDFDEMDEDYSATELPCVEASIDVLRVFRRCLKAANESFNTLDSAQPKPGGEAGGVREDWLRERLTWAKSVQANLDDANECAGEVGILLYPPLDGGELLRRANDLETSLTAFCGVFDACEGGESEARESTLRTAVAERISALKTAIDKL